MFLPSSFFFSSRRRHTIFDCDWSSDVCSSDLDQLDSLMDITLGALQALQARNPNVIAHFNEPPYAWVRSEERRVGKECRSRGTAEQLKKKAGWTKRTRRMSRCLEA